MTILRSLTAITLALISLECITVLSNERVSAYEHAWGSPRDRA